MYKLDERCLNNAIDCYRRSLKRKDLSEEGQVIGAIQAYKRQEEVVKLYESIVF